jgi:hypothetical protein
VGSRGYSLSSQNDQKKDLTGGGGRDRIEVRHEEESVMVLD